MKVHLADQIKNIEATNRKNFYALEYALYLLAQQVKMTKQCTAEYKAQAETNLERNLQEVNKLLNEHQKGGSKWVSMETELD